MDSHRTVDGCGKIFLAGDPDELLHELTVLQDDHGRDGHDAELLRHLAVGIDIELSDLGGSFKIGGQFIDDRRKLPTGAAPFRPEIDDDRLGGLHGLGCEIGVGELEGGGTGHANGSLVTDMNRRRSATRRIEECDRKGGF